MDFLKDVGRDFDICYKKLKKLHFFIKNCSVKPKTAKKLRFYMTKMNSRLNIVPFYTKMDILNLKIALLVPSKHSSVALA